MILVSRWDGNNLESVKWGGGSSRQKKLTTRDVWKTASTMSVCDSSFLPPTSPLLFTPSAALAQRKYSPRDLCWPWNSANKPLKANPHYKCQSGRVASFVFFFPKWYHLQPLTHPTADWNIYENMAKITMLKRGGYYFGRVALHGYHSSILQTAPTLIANRWLCQSKVTSAAKGRCNRWTVEAKQSDF